MTTGFRRIWRWAPTSAPITGSAPISNDCSRFFALLREYWAELAGNLSGGQQQILEMAMALMPRPTLLMIDEPSLGLSPIMLKQVFDYVVEINRAGVTVLMVGQNARQALAVSHYGIALELGQVLLEDTGEAILANEEIRRRYLGRTRETRTNRAV